MQGGWFGAMERIHNLVSRAKRPNGQNEGDQSYFCCFFFDVEHMLFLFFLSERSAKQFRQIGQNCKGKHEGEVS